MAFDGITISGLINEIKNTFIPGRITKINQPEKDALILTLKNEKEQRMLLLSASPSLPLCYFTEEKRVNPLSAPTFCMLLRKHLNNARIIDVTQPSFERIIDITLTHLNELGDECKKHLIVELMGKHSNIIFTDDDNMILDAIRHVPSSVSSVREVLPGREYFIPNTLRKMNPLEVDKEKFFTIMSADEKASDVLQKSLIGLSNVAASEIILEASLYADTVCSSLLPDEKEHLFNIYQMFFEKIKIAAFSPRVYFKNGIPYEYTLFPYDLFNGLECKEFSSVSEMLDFYFNEKDKAIRIKQKSLELRNHVTKILERDVKKYDLQKKQYSDTDKKDKFKVYGELLHTYGYDLKGGEKELKCINYYDNNEITIPLDPEKTAAENAKAYFDKYSKLKRTREALDNLLKETADNIEYLENVMNALKIAETEDDLKAIRNELTETAFIRKHASNKKEKYKSTPLHFKTSEGFDVYVGKNNNQNDELTFKFADNKDYFFHAKRMPGSHVILKYGTKEFTDKAYEEAAALAAYFSKGRDNGKVDVDYVIKKEVKKPNGAKPGFVVYYTNYSMTVTPSIESLTRIDD